MAFPLIHVRPNGVPVGTMKFRVHVHHRLHVIVARGNLGERVHRISQSVAIERSDRARFQSHDIDAEERRTITPSAHLQARLRSVVRADHDKSAPGDGFGVHGSGKRNFEFDVRGRGFRRPIEFEGAKPDGHQKRRRQNDQ